MFIEEENDYYERSDTARINGKYVLHYNPPTIREYHCSVRPKDYSNTWGIGFEVEKNDIDGTNEYGEEHEKEDLFIGWEQDGSCGVEGITHIYDLESGYDLFCTHVDASALVNEECGSDCGGHVNISGPEECLTMDSIRKYSGLLYALYRKRLKGEYSHQNKDLKKEYENDFRYACIRRKDNPCPGKSLYEFRLVARVQTGEQLKRRFRMFQKIIIAMENGISFPAYLKSCEDLLSEIYPSTKEILSLARHFNRYISKGIINNKIQDYI